MQDEKTQETLDESIRILVRTSAFLALGNAEDALRRCDRQVIERMYQEVGEACDILGMGSDALDAGLHSAAQHGFLEAAEVEDLALFAADMRERLLQWSGKEFRIPTSVIDIIDNTKKVLDGESRTALTQLAVSIGIFKDEALSVLARNALSDQTRQWSQRTILPRLEELVQYFEGKSYRYNLDKRECKAAKAKDPELYEDEFLVLRREARAIAKEFVRQWVRLHGEGGLVPFNELKEAMYDADIKVSNLDFDGFEGYVDDMSRIYNSNGVLIDGLPGGGTVEMNPEYDPETDDSNVFKVWIPGSVDYTYFYTTEMKAKGVSVKFDLVEDILAERIEEFRERWLDVLYDWDGADIHDENLLCALVMEIIYHTQARIGSSGNQTEVDGEYRRTFGISTLLCKHIKLVENQNSSYLQIRYPGKKHVTQTHKLLLGESEMTDSIVDLLLSFKEERRPNDPVFLKRNGKPISGSMVNAFMRGHVGVPDSISVHKIRHAKGCFETYDIVDNHPFRDLGHDHGVTTAVINKWMDKQLLEVGKALGHVSGEKITAATAKQNYCPPRKRLEVYADAGVTPPKELMKLLGADPHDLESHAIIMKELRDVRLQQQQGLEQ